MTIRAMFFDMDNTLSVGNSFRDLYCFLDDNSCDFIWNDYVQGKNGYTYIDALKPLAEALRAKKVTRAKLVHLFNQTPLTRGLEATISDLQNRGIKCVVVTCGSEELYKRIDAQLMRVNGRGFDDWYGVKTIYDKDNVVLDFVPSFEYMDKGAPIREYQKLHGLKKEECASIGDSLGDYGMFLECGISFSYNPSGELLKRIFEGRLNKELDGCKIIGLSRGEFNNILEYV